MRQGVLKHLKICPIRRIKQEARARLRLHLIADLANIVEDYLGEPEFKFKQRPEDELTRYFGERTPIKNEADKRAHLAKKQESRRGR